MFQTEFRIHNDGKIELQSGEIRIVGIFPYENGLPIVPQSIEKDQSSVRYHTERGILSISLQQRNGCLVLSTSLDGFEGNHDIEPIGEAVLFGAVDVYTQGPGMGGPSGYAPISGEERGSHGIIALCNEDTSLVLYTEDHRRFDAVFSAKEKTDLFSKKQTLSFGFNLEGTASAKTELPALYLKAGKNTAECLAFAAEQIADAMKARHCMPPAFYWCSWYYYYENFSQELLEKNLQELGEAQTDFQYIQIDAGYTVHIGDWLHTNHRYPDGLGRAAASIREAGYGAGIWIAPFLVGDQSELYRLHPDWIVRDLEDEPYVVFRSYTEPKIWASRDSNYYILDITHPEAFAYIKQVFQTLKGFGYSLYKTDFMLWGMVDSSKVKRYDGSRTSVEILRQFLSMVREVIGEDSFLLGSIAPFMPFIGYADAMRIAGDNGAQWSNKYGPVNLLQEMPFDNYFNHIFWQNDPDAIVLRDFESHLTKEETWSLVLLQALSGGVVTTSDPVMRLSEDRRRWLSFIRPRNKVHAEFPYLTRGAEEMVIIHRLEDWNLVFAINPTEHPVKVFFELEELFGEKNWYLYRYAWDDGREVRSEKRKDFFDVLLPHDSVLLFVTEAPIGEKPLSLWNR